MEFIFAQAITCHAIKEIKMIKKLFLLPLMIMFSLASYADNTIKQKSLAQSTTENNSNYVSTELFNLFEHWQSGLYQTMPLEEYVQATSGQTYAQWLRHINNNLGAATIIRYFQSTEPQQYYNFQQAFKLDYNISQASKLIDYIRSKKPLAFRQFKQNMLVEKKLTLADFLPTNKMSLLTTWQEEQNKGNYNIHGSLAQYINNHANSQRVVNEARVVLANMGITPQHLPTGERDHENNAQDRGTECNCSVTITNQGNPNDLNTLSTYAPQSHAEYRNNGQVKRSWSRDKTAMGAAHSIRVDRYTYGGRDNQVDSSLTSNFRSVTLKITCLDENSFACNGYCSGDIVAEAFYHSDLKADINITGGIFSKQGIAVVSDNGKLTLQTAGFSSGSEETLFNKTLAIDREYQTEYDTDALMTLVKSAVGVTSAIMTAGSSSALAATISADSVADTVKASIGLIKKTGKSASYIDKDMQAIFKTADTYANIFFDNSAAVTLKLSSDARAFAEGNNGVHNTGWAQIDSAYFLAAGATNFQCSGDVTGIPDKVSNWSYGRTAGAEISQGNLQNNINAFLISEMAQSTDFSTGSTGGIITVTPDYPPNAVCNITPSTGVNSLAATMNGSASSDPDGSIVNYQWLRFPDHTAQQIIATGVTADLIINEAPRSYSGLGGIHLRVTDDIGLTDTVYCGNVIVTCTDEYGNPCPMTELPAEPAELFIP